MIDRVLRNILILLPVHGSTVLTRLSMDSVVNECSYSFIGSCKFDVPTTVADIIIG